MSSSINQFLEFTDFKKDLWFFIWREYKCLTSWRRSQLQILDIKQEVDFLDKHINENLWDSSCYHECSNVAVFVGKKIILSFFLKYGDAIPDDPNSKKIFLSEKKIAERMMQTVKEFEGICYENGKILPGPLRKPNYADVVSQLREDNRKFIKWTGMSQRQFTKLLSHVEEKLESLSYIGAAVPDDFKLLITLKHIVLGHSHKKIHKDYYPLSISTIRIITYRTMLAILEMCQKKYVENGFCDIREITRDFYKTCKLPNCIGVMGIKRVKIQKPRFFAEDYLDDMNTYSVVIKVVCDSGGDFRFLRIDKDTASDMDFSRSKKLPGTQEKFQLFYAAEPSVPPSQHIIVPYVGENLTEAEQNLNMRLSLATNPMEYTFAALANRFKMFRGAIHGEVKKIFMEGDARVLIKTALLLNNFINMTMDHQTPPTTSIRPADSAIFDEKINTEPSTSDVQAMRNSFKNYLWKTRFCK